MLKPSLNNKNFENKLFLNFYPWEKIKFNQQALISVKKIGTIDVELVGRLDYIPEQWIVTSHSFIDDCIVYDSAAIYSINNYTSDSIIPITYFLIKNAYTLKFPDFEYTKNIAINERNRTLLLNSHAGKWQKYFLFNQDTLINRMLDIRWRKKQRRHSFRKLLKKLLKNKK